MESKTKYGIEQRKKDRERREDRTRNKVINEMPELISKYAPLLQYEEKEIDVSSVNEQIASLLTNIKESSKTLLYKKCATDYLADLISYKNDEYGWNINIPPRIYSIKRNDNPRTLNRFVHGRVASNLHLLWRKQVLNSGYDSLDPLADIVISAIVYGGLASSEAVLSFANTVSSERKPFHQYEDYIWIDLVWKSRKKLGNYYTRDADREEWKTIQRFYPDTFTLALILKHEEKLESTDLNQETLWLRICRRLGYTETFSKDSIKSLRQFCIGCQSITENLDGVDLSQAYIGLANDELSTSSLTPHIHDRWITNSAFEVEGYPITFQSSFSGVPIDSKLHPDEIKIFNGRILRKIREALKPDGGATKKSPREAAKQLKQLLQKENHLSIVILIEWLAYSLESIKTSSALRYFDEVGEQWLYYTYGQYLVELDENDWVDIYEQILESRTSINALAYLKGRLASLHDYVQAKIKDAPSLKEYFRDNRGNGVRKRVRSGIIPLAVYEAIKSRITKIEIKEEFFKLGLRVLVMLAYRTGLRRGELLKLRLIDVEDSPESWLFIRDNRYGNNKTQSSLRKVPAGVLLTSNEYQEFHKYITHRKENLKDQKQALVFSMPNTPFIPLDANALSSVIKQILIEQGLPELTFHHFRHSALSNLLLVVEKEFDLVQKYVGYSEDQSKKIISTIFSLSDAVRKHKYWAIAGVAGHLTPDTTFSNYIHITDFILSYKLRYTQLNLNINEAKALTGLSTYALGFVESGNYQLSDLRSIICKKLDRKSRKVKIKNKVNAEHSEYQIKYNHNISTCYLALKDIENGESLEQVASRYYIDVKKLSNWHENALSIQNRETIHKNKRHVPRAKQKKGGLYLVPHLPMSHKELRNLDRIFVSLRKVYKDQQESFQWSTEYWLKNKYSNHSGLRFNNPKDMEQFLKPFMKVFTGWKWRLEIPRKYKGDKSEWVKVLPKGSLITEMDGHYAFLYLSHPEEDRIVDIHKNTISKYSSNFLDYVNHMLSITGLDYK